MGFHLDIDAAVKRGALVRKKSVVVNLKTCFSVVRQEVQRFYFSRICFIFKILVE